MQVQTTELLRPVQPPPLPDTSADFSIPIDVTQSIRARPMSPEPAEALATGEIDLFAMKASALAPPPLPKLEETGLTFSASGIAMPKRNRFRPAQRKRALVGAAVLLGSILASMGIWAALHSGEAPTADDLRASTPTEMSAPPRKALPADPVTAVAVPTSGLPVAPEPTATPPAHAEPHRVAEPPRANEKTTADRPAATQNMAVSKPAAAEKATAERPAASEKTAVVEKPGAAERLAPIAKEIAVAPAQPEPPAPRAAPPAPAFGDLDLNAEFDRNAAMQALRQAGDSAMSCRSLGAPEGSTRVNVTFARTGSVSDVALDGAAAGSAAAGCISNKFRSLRVPPFRGSSMTVRKTLAF